MSLPLNLLEVRHWIVEIDASDVVEAIKRAIGLDTEQLVEPDERHVVTSSRLFTPGIGEPWAEADALHQRRWLPGRCHCISDIEISRVRPTRGAGLRLPTSRNCKRLATSPNNANSCGRRCGIRRIDAGPRRPLAASGRAPSGTGGTTRRGAEARRSHAAGSIR